VRGELDIATAPVLDTVLVPLTKTGDGVTVDLSGVSFVDPSGLRVLLRTVDANVGRGRMKVFNPSPSVRRLFELANVTTLFDVLADASEHQETVDAVSADAVIGDTDVAPVTSLMSRST